MRHFYVLLATLTLASGAAATEWQALGPRATAMGGAGVALPQGALSSYWNPAALGLQDNPSGLQVPVGANLGLSGSVLKGANDLNQVNKDCRAGSAACTDANVRTALDSMNDPRNGVRGGLAAGAGVKVGRLGLFANNLTQIGAKPRMDTANNSIGTVQNNTSALELRGIAMTEIGAAYGRELPFAPGLHAGLALKAISGQVGFQSLGVVSSDPGSGSLEQFRKNGRSSVQPGVDLGLLWDAGRTLDVSWRPRLGLTARNINNPRFHNSPAAIAAGAGSTYSVQGGVRAGVALSPLPFWNLVADADLTRNLTSVAGVKSQQLGAGTELNVFNRPWLNIPLRAGLAKNLADPTAKMMLTAGLGLNFLHVILDVGAQTTSRSQTIQTQGDTKKAPSELSVSGQFSVMFGGGAARPAEVLASEKPKKARPKTP